nr:hypothetical protein Iba_chr05dCG11630 [Ipomoea batatas]
MVSCLRIPTSSRRKLCRAFRMKPTKLQKATSSSSITEIMGEKIAACEGEYAIHSSFARIASTRMMRCHVAKSSTLLDGSSEESELDDRYSSPEIFASTILPLSPSGSTNELGLSRIESDAVIVDSLDPSCIGLDAVLVGSSLF